LIEGATTAQRLLSSRLIAEGHGAAPLESV
jgi:hypothetical protein